MRLNRTACFACVLAACNAVPGLAQNTDPVATGAVTGFTSNAGKKGEKQHYTILLNLNWANAGSDPGAVVAFGAMDNGDVVWLAQTDYRPTLRPASARREFVTPKAPLALAQTPRYLMVCAWHLDDQRKPVGTPFSAYAERDDSGAIVGKPGREQDSLTVHWVPVPAQRARAKFAGADYCGGAQRARTSAVPHWMADAPKP